MASYLRPTQLNDALIALAGGQPTILAGGTDLYPAAAHAATWGRPQCTDGDLLDITALAELRGIEEREDDYRLGALTTWSELLRAPLPALFDGLRAAAREVGGVQIQNRATLGGNLCNASPAADGAAALLALGARLELRSQGGHRLLPIESFLLGNRATARAADELLTAIIIPKPQHTTRTAFLKLGARRYLVISIVMVAATLGITANGRVASARVAVGACAPTARRLPDLETALIDQAADAPLDRLVRPEHFAPLSPIDDARADRNYRRKAASVLVQRALQDLSQTMQEAAA